MNPISPTPAPAPATVRTDPTRDEAADPNTAASIFAAIFAASAVPPVPLPIPVSVPVATPCAAGEIPQAPPGGWPGGTASGLPAFPAFGPKGRPRLELPASAGTLADLAPARRDLGDVAAHVAVPGATPLESAKPAPPAPLPAIASPPQPAVAATTATPAIAAALAAAVQARVSAAAAAKPAAKPSPATGADKSPDTGPPLSAKLAVDGGVPVKVGAPGAGAESGGNTSQSGRGRARTAASANAGAAAPPLVAGSAAGAPPLPPAAQVVGTVPHASFAEAPAAPAAAPQAAAPLLEPRPQPAMPSHATVAFDSGDGQEGRLRVSLRGNTLTATIQMPDAAAAQRLEQDSAGLTRALRAQGFDEARLVIDAPSAPGSGQQSGDDTSPREHKHPREGQPHSGERHARRERGNPRNER